MGGGVGGGRWREGVTNEKHIEQRESRGRNLISCVLQAEVGGVN